MAEHEGTLSFADDTGAAERRFVAPYLVRLSSADQPHRPSARLSIAEVRQVRIGRGAELAHRRSSEDGVPVLAIEVPDGWMSTRHAELVREDRSWRLRDAGSKNGTFVGGSRIGERALADGDVIEAGNTFFLFRDRVERSVREPADLDGARGVHTLSPPLARLLSELERLAPSAVPVLLCGETGTGKEVTARLLHRASRRSGELVAVNCGALPANLIESELFGHRKGAFSGAASDRVGTVQAADGGTLFLDEIAELPLEAQVVLLRVLQEREVTPVGGTRPVRVDLRVVAATHEDLEQRVAEGRFRADLLARLAGHTVTLPPLRERREDLGLLLRALLERLGAATVRFERDALRALFEHDWPRNVRELEQALGAACALAAGGRITRAHLPDAIGAAGETSVETADDAALRARLVRLLGAHGGNVSAVAREMDKARVQIRRWCKRLGLDPKDYRQ